MSFSSYQDPKNLFAVFNHAKQCVGQDFCEKPGCVEMKGSFPHMENCLDGSCTELSCSILNRMKEAIWCDYVNCFTYELNSLGSNGK